MAQQVIDTTTPQPNGKQGEPIRTAFGKANANFDELYDEIGELGTAARGDLQSLSTDYFGPDAPAVTWPGMTWGDQANELLKRRNAANSAWISLGPLFDYMYGRGNILGNVSQAGGVPTGAVIQSGANSNGTFTRWADGTQICRHNISLAITATSGQLFRSGANDLWTYPASFSASPVVTGNGNYGNRPGVSSTGVPGTLSTSIIVFATSLDAVARDIGVTATGRWFG